MRDSIRLTLRMHRFEVVAILVFAGTLVLGAYWVAGRLDAVGYGQCAIDESPPPSCEALGRAFYEIQENQATPIFGFLAILPYVAGLFLGGPIIAREIERGTTRLAWSIAPSRLRWYLWRVVPVLVLLVFVTFAGGVAAAMESEEAQTKYPIVALVIPGERYRMVEAREAIALGGIALVMLAGTAVIVGRRRPG